MSEICSRQKNENTCNSLKFKAKNRCKYEAKWLSFVRGGNCFISEEIIKDLLDDLHPYIAFDWKNMKVNFLPIRQYNLPNTENFSKQDLVNILHDLTFHIRNVFKDKDLVTILSEKHGVDIINLNEETLLYYVYLFSFVIYISQFLSVIDFKSLLKDNNAKSMQILINNPPSLQNLEEFIKFFFSIIPNVKHQSIGWDKRLLAGILLSMLIIGFLPALGVLLGVIGNFKEKGLSEIKNIYSTTSLNEYLTDNAKIELMKFVPKIFSEENILNETVDITIIDNSDPSDLACRVAGLARIGEIYMTNPEDMVEEIIKKAGNKLINRLDIIDHGNQQGIYIGEVFITIKNIHQYGRYFPLLRSHFAKNASIYLNHCNVGQNFPLIKKLAELFGVPIYAGTGFTSAHLGINTGSYIKCDPDGSCNIADYPHL